MSSSRSEILRRTARWLLPAAVLALVPKCLVCVLAYAGLGAALGLRGVEICGGAPSTLVGTLVRVLAWVCVSATVVWRLRTADCGPRISEHGELESTRQ